MKRFSSGHPPNVGPAYGVEQARHTAIAIKVVSNMPGTPALNRFNFANVAISLRLAHW